MPKTKKPGKSKPRKPAPPKRPKAKKKAEQPKLPLSQRSWNGDDGAGDTFDDTDVNGDGDE